MDDSASDREVPLSKDSHSRTRFWGALPKVLGMVVLLGIVVSLLAQAFANQRSQARFSQAKCRLKQIGLALHNYHDEYKCLPPAYVVDGAGKKLHSWRVLLLPYLDAQQLYDRYDFSKPWDSEQNLALQNEMPEIYRPVSEGKLSGKTDVMAIIDEKTIWPGATSSRFRDVTDGLSHTILLLMVPEEPVSWLSPEDFDLKRARDRLQNPSEIPEAKLVLFADGGVQEIKHPVDERSAMMLLEARDGQLACCGFHDF